MIKLGKLVKEIIDGLPANHVQYASHNTSTNDFINYIKFVENGQKRGYDKVKKLWFPIKSVEGGLPTIGYGHKIKDNTEPQSMKKGMSDSDVSSLLQKDLDIAHGHVKDYIKRVYKVDLLLTPRQSEMLTDFAFNLGGLNKFPKFVDAVLRNQTEKIKHEYKRHAGGKELKGRNHAFFNRFLK